MAQYEATVTVGAKINKGQFDQAEKANAGLTKAVKGSGQAAATANTKLKTGKTTLAGHSKATKGATQATRNQAETTERGARAQSRSNEQIRQGTKAVRKYGEATVKAVGQAKGFGRGIGSAINGLPGRLSALTGGLTTGVAVKYIGDLEERFTRLGIQANASSEDIAKLEDEIFAVSQLPEIRLDPSQITGAIEKIVEKTGDLNLAKDNIYNIAAAIQASGAEGAAIGAMVADFAEKFGISGPEAMLAVLDRIVRQGKQGAFTLQNMAQRGEQLTAAYAALGRTGPEALSEMGAMVQLIRKGTGSAEQATTAFEGLLRDILSKSDRLEDLGIDIIDEEATAASGRRVYKSVTDLVKEIITATEGDAQQLGDIFGDEAKRALTATALEFQQTGAFGTLDRIAEIKGDGQQLVADSTKAASTFNSAARSLMTAVQTVASEQFTGPIQSLADAMNAFGSENTATTIKILGGSVAALTAGYAGYKALSAGNAVVQGSRALLGRGRAGGRAVGVPGAMPAAARGIAVQRVMVVNWPRGTGGFNGYGQGGGRTTRGRSTGRGGRLSQGLNRLMGLPGMEQGGKLLKGGGKLLGRVATPLLLGMTALDLAQAESGEQAGSAVGSLGGSLAGMAAGAALGSVVPVIGTVIGAAIGGFAGSFGGEKAGGWLGSLFDSDELEKETEEQPEEKSFWDRVGNWFGSDDEDKEKASAAEPTEAQKSDRPIQVTTNITLAQQPGQDTENLAAMIGQEVDRSTRRALHDGGDEL